MFVINAMYAVFMFNRAVQHEGNILQTSFFFSFWKIIRHVLS